MNISGQDLIRHVRLSVQDLQLLQVSDLVLDRVSQPDTAQQPWDVIREQGDRLCPPCC